MRWLVGWPLTALIVRADGSGFCEGTGQAVDPDVLCKVMLAGLAAEFQFEPFPLEYVRYADVDAAADLPRGPDGAETLDEEFERVCAALRPHAALVEIIAARLLKEGGALSAEAVAAICGEFKART
jgi:hypothetical protein